MCPGIIPAFAFPGEITPGQFGPTSRVVRPSRNVMTRNMSSVGIPSVMQTTSGRLASAASRIASPATGGGTKITEALAPVSRTACSTVLKTGQPSCIAPPLPGVMPPTTFVPNSAACLAWNVPSRPVRPLHEQPRPVVNKNSHLTPVQVLQPAARPRPCYRPS